MATDRETSGGAGSQTLDRGLQALELLAQANSPLSIAQLSEQLGVHRSNAYRILRTLEAHRFVVRDNAGMIHLGPRLASLGRGAASTLQQVVQPELATLANDLLHTTFLAVLDANEVITILTAEPPYSHAAVAQKLGAVHPIHRGATGRAIESALTPAEHRHLLGDQPLSEEALLVRERGYALSNDEVVPGLTSIAVPLRMRGEPPASLAIVSPGMPEQPEYVAEQLRNAALRIERFAN